MLQLMSASNSIKERRLGSNRRWVYSVSSSILLLEVQDIPIDRCDPNMVTPAATCEELGFVTAGEGLYLNNEPAEITFRSNEYFNSSLAEVTFSDSQNDRIAALELEVSRLREILDSIVRTVGNR